MSGKRAAFSRENIAQAREASNRLRG